MAKLLEGVIVSTKLAPKTVTVRVEERFRHPLYQKVVKTHKKYLVHNEKLELHEGDIVRIQETRPLSKKKRFTVIEKLQK